MWCRCSIKKGILVLSYMLLFFVNMPGLFVRKTKKVVQLRMSFKTFLDSGSKLNKIWVSKGSEFCIRTTKSWPQEKAIEIQHIMKENLLLLKNLLEL